ncbi:MAG: MASE3 domain-containing protein [Promethearchaeia archaeon]
MLIQEEAKRKNSISYLILIIITYFIFSLSFYSYLLFHIIVELFSVSIAISVFIIGWNSLKFNKNPLFSIISISFLFIGIIDLLHALSYKGLNVFIGYSINLSVQLWIVARYIQASSFLFGFILINRELNPKIVFFSYLFLTIIIIFTIFTGFFPRCYIEGKGLTPFNMISEYIIISISIITIFLIKINYKFDKIIGKYFIFSLIFLIGSEFCFILLLNLNLNGFLNLLGFIFKIFSFFFIYLSIIEVGLKRPYNLIFRELSQKSKRLQTEIYKEKRLLRNLKYTKLEAELSNMAKTKFLATMSHELRTPLNAIIGFTQLILEEMIGPLTDEQKEYLNDILDSGEFLLSLISDILNISKIEAGKLKLHYEKVNVRKLIDTSVRIFEEKLKRSNLTLDIHINGDIDYLIGDEIRIKQIIFNLLSNALKYTYKGGNIIISIKKKNNYFLFSISDTGIGISEKDLKYLFKPFQRIETLANKNTPGMGLGLYYTKKLVKLHGGSIWVESQEKKGSTFYFTIPIYPKVRSLSSDLL